MKTFAAWLFGVIVALRNRLYDLKLLAAKSLPGRVISVGNIAVGGTGKSPVVIAVAHYLSSQGLRCAVLTRGYKSGLGTRHWMVLLKGARVAGAGNSTAKPDEAMMQSEVLPEVPIVVGARRYAAAKMWLKYCQEERIACPDVWILDDGFQHRKLKRDLDMVLIDSRCPFGALLPKGRFREPTESLARADIILFTRADQRHPKSGDFSFPAAVAPHAVIEKVEFEWEKPRCVFDCPGTWSNDRFLLVAGIAEPQQFKQSALAAGVTVSATMFVGDHAPLYAAGIKPLLEPGVAILTTSKDWARSCDVLTTLGHAVFVLPLKVTLPGAVLSRLHQR